MGMEPTWCREQGPGMPIAVPLEESGPAVFRELADEIILHLNLADLANAALGLDKIWSRATRRRIASYYWSTLELLICHPRFGLKTASAVLNQKSLDLSHGRFDHSDVTIFCGALAIGALPQLTELYL